MSLKKPVGRYITIRKLEKSGMAASYLAYDPLFERKVVVKVFAGHLMDDPAFCSRLQQQSEIALNLAHPSFVPLHEVVKEEGVLHVVMSYMEGASLAQRLQDKGRFSLQQARDLLADLAKGLAYLHEQDMVHGNIKTNNILFNQAGEAHLADFGMSTVAAQQDEEGEALLCPYQPPEAKVGQAFDASADIYQLGVLLFEMLTGHTPPINKAPLLSCYRADLPTRCNQVITRALQPEKAARYATVEELLTALDAAMAQPSTPCAAEKEAPEAILPSFNRRHVASFIPWRPFASLFSPKAASAPTINAQDSQPSPQRLRVGFFLSTLLAWLMFVMRIVTAVVP